jgi:hypothetical protein
VNRKISLLLSILYFPVAVSYAATYESENREPESAAVDFAQIRSPVIFQGDAVSAYRDPAVLYHEGCFHLFFTVCRLEKGIAYWYLGYSRSYDLRSWEQPRLLTPRNRHLNYSSPGNVIRFGNEWILCLQTYPTPDGENYGNADSRIWLMRSEDLTVWSEPELLQVKGPNVPRRFMGRMIDPYLLADKDEPGKWWCFYKQNGVSLSWSYDLKNWTYAGHYDAGENVCVLIEEAEYILFHSPENGIAVKRSPDLRRWRDWGGLITLGQDDWDWARGRLTAAVVIDLRQVKGIGCYLMFFHGSERAGLKVHPAHGRASLALAWSRDLVHWEWPRASD